MSLLTQTPGTGKTNTANLPRTQLSQQLQNSDGMLPPGTTRSDDHDVDEGRGIGDGAIEERSFDTFPFGLPPFIPPLEVLLVDDATFALGDFVCVWAISFPPLDL